jgi:hypothetical protein
MASRPGATAKVFAKSQLKLLVDHSVGEFAILLGLHYEPSGLFSRMFLGRERGSDASATQLAFAGAWAMLNGLIALGAVVGLFLALWQRRYRLLFICVPTILLFMAATGGVGLERFRLPMLLPLLLLASSVFGCCSGGTGEPTGRD